MNEAVIYSICAMSSIVLSRALNEDFNKKFREKTIDTIFTHFNVKEKTKKTYSLLLLNCDETMAMDPYYATIKGDESAEITDILRELLVVFISQGTYSSRVRFFLLQISSGLHITMDDFLKCEYDFVCLLGNGQCIESDQSESIARNKKRKVRQTTFIGAAAIGGGILIGITGGLAAPVIAAGIGVLGSSIGGGILSGLSAALSTTAGAAMVGSLFGGAGAGISGMKMEKRIGDLTEFIIEPFSTGMPRRLTVAIAITGYLDHCKTDFYSPWETLTLSDEQYYLIWETKYLLDMSKSMDYLLSFVKSAALVETLKLTALGSLLSAVVWPSALLTMSSVIDNPWSVCLSRAESAGRALADELVSGAVLGRRPISLIGFSLGARIIFYCLQELASRQSDVVHDIVDEVYLIGAPVTASVDLWSRLERVVTTRIVNAYCRSDWILKFLFRTSLSYNGLAGLQSVEWNNRQICNIDISSIVTGHRDYASKMSQILQFIEVGRT